MTSGLAGDGKGLRSGLWLGLAPEWWDQPLLELPLEILNVAARPAYPQGLHHETLAENADCDFARNSSDILGTVTFHPGSPSDEIQATYIVLSPFNRAALEREHINLHGQLT